MANVKTSTVALDNPIANPYGAFIGTAINKLPIATDASNSYGAYGRGDTLANDLNLIGITGVPDVSRPIYRGLVGSVYVYSLDSPPGGGATDIIIIGYT